MLIVLSAIRAKQTGGAIMEKSDLFDKQDNNLDEKPGTSSEKKI